MTEVGYYRHGLHRMLGRDRGEHRVASPLELLYDLTYVAAFGVAGEQLADSFANGHGGAGVIAYVFTMLTVLWAWTNFSWFSSAFDTDDWLFRLLTAVQMVGVVVLAVGIPRVFDTLERADGVIDNRLLLAGYVIMRVPLVVQWVRAGLTAPRYRFAALCNAVFIGGCQVGWVALAAAQLPAARYLLAGGVLLILEMIGPVVAERGRGRSAGIPWHAHHMAERYSLLAIIALGETLLGTLAAVEGATADRHWSVDATVVAVIGVALLLALWWLYSFLPSAPVLQRDRSRGYVWGYGHIPLYIAVAAVGAGMHLIGVVDESGARVSSHVVVAVIAGAVALFETIVLALHCWLLRGAPANIATQLAALALPVLGLLCALFDVPMPVCLVLVALGPAVTVISFECGQWRSMSRQLGNRLSPQ